MKIIKDIPIERYGYDFVPQEFLPAGADEYWVRNAQQVELFSRKPEDWRRLKEGEIEILKTNRNQSPNWKDILVRDPFDPSLIRDSSFYGLVRLGALRNILLKHHDFCVPAGIRNSTIISCDIGDDTAIQDCTYISHYIIGNNCILSNVDELQATNHCKFGNGVVMDGESEDVRVWIDVMNEAGGRSVLPFADMIAADAYIWAAYRDDTAFTEKLAQITQKQYAGHRGSYGIIGSGAVIKSCAVIKDTAVGESAYIKGANKIKNLTILSSHEERTQIGEGVEMVNGIVGYACSVFYGSKAVRFVMGRNSNLKYGARLIHSVLGDNSTVSCCEILNNLIFPVHEQHHNNSFLIASLVQGMSNMAAAATVGSNHNSRANDGEIRANRGFWPGLAVSLKHSSVFASFVIIAKGEYPSELNIPLPFSLVSNNVYKNRLEVMPAYFWLHNMYALERNSWKAQNRDRRKVKIQRIESDYLAPDTAEEIINALSLLKGWLEDAAGLGEGAASGEEGEVIKQISCRYFEHGKRGQIVIKPLEASEAYKQMLRYYAVKTLAVFLDEHLELTFDAMVKQFSAETKNGRVKEWVNAGGQIVPAFRVDKLREEVREGKFKNWQEIHKVYESWEKDYPLDRCRHAWSVLEYMRSTDGQSGTINKDEFKKELAAVIETRRFIDTQIYNSREKDYDNTFKKATFRNQAEMEQVLGKPGDNSFIKLIHKESAQFIDTVERVIARI